MSDGLPPLREVIAAHGLAAKKSLGQNFLEVEFDGLRFGPSGQCAGDSGSRLKAIFWLFGEHLRDDIGHALWNLWDKAANGLRLFSLMGLHHVVRIAVRERRVAGQCSV